MEDIEARVAAFVAAQNASDIDALINSYSPNGARIFNGQEVRGREALRVTYDKVWKALTNRTMTVQHVTVSGSTAILEYIEVATHSAPVGTPYGELQATGKQFTIHGCAVLNFADDGIAEVRVYSNALFHLLALSQGMDAK